MTARPCLSEDDVIELVEGSLDADKLAAVEAHLSSCEECPRLVAAIAEELSSGAKGSRAAASSASVGAVTPAPPERRPGDRVGRYEILRTVGQGAMGRVYAAHDPALDRVVAIKLLHPRMATPQLEGRLQREAKAMARLSHPEVVAVYDAGREGDQLFIAMELVEGGTLRQWQQAAPRSWRAVLDVYLRAGRGLAQAHAAGLIHRDFKPDNVLIGDDGRVRVTDFGLARAGDAVEASDPPAAREPVDGALDRSLTRTGMLLGTPAYMAPEQLRGAPADARSDVYAFCVSLWEALYGARPFDGLTLAELTAAKASERVRAEPVRSEVPHALRRALLVGLRADPEARYPSAAAMLTALEASVRPTRGRARWAALGVGITLLAAAPFGWKRWSAETRAPTPVVAPSAVASAPRCSAKACAESHGDAPYACRQRDGACVALGSEDCEARFEPRDLAADDTVWIGAMFPTKGPNADGFGRMNVETIDMARAEIAEATRGLAEEGASKHVRRIALVACDDSVDAKRAAKHLVEEVGVPAILGFGSGQELIDLASTELIPRHVVAVGSISHNPLITRVPQPADLPRLLWQTTYSANETADAIAALVNRVLEPKVSDRARPTRVTLVHAGASLGAWVADELERSLVINGKPAVENGALYTELVMKETTKPALTELAARVVEARPAIVVFAGDRDVEHDLVSTIEASWSPATPRPTYMLADCETDGLSKFIAASAERRHRVFALCSPSNEPNTVRFVARYNATHARQVDVYFNASTSYDAFYALAYAVFAIGGEPVDGPEIARNFARLVPPGRAVDVGPLAMFDALATLDEGKSIDLRGAAGALDFDPKTGTPPSDFALLCPGVDAVGVAHGTIESGVFYRVAAHVVEGTMRCP